MDEEAAAAEEEEAEPVRLLGAAGEELLWRLLRWRPGARMRLEDVARHPFFAEEEEGAA